MAKEKEQEEVLSKLSTGTTRPIEVRLDQIVRDPTRYGHRNPEALTKKVLQPLMDSIVLEGMQVPIEVAPTDDPAKYLLVKGHCRVAAHELLADENQPKFDRSNIKLAALLVENAAPNELLVRSIMDNAVRFTIDPINRIKAAKMMFDEGIPGKQAAGALGVTRQTYVKDLLLAQHEWMLKWVMDDCIQATNAFTLLDEAKKANRLNELEQDVAEWVAQKQQLIREKERHFKAAHNKDLRPGEKQVKKYLTDTLRDHWVDCLRKGNRFDEDAQWNFAAGIEKEKERLSIAQVTLDLKKAPLDQLAKVAGKLSRIAKDLAPYLQKRREEEQLTVSTPAEEGPYDLAYLRDLGLEDVADELLREYGAEDAVDEEGAPGDKENAPASDDSQFTSDDEPPEALPGVAQPTAPKRPESPAKAETTTPSEPETPDKKGK